MSGLANQPTTCIRCGSPTYSTCRFCNENCCGVCLYRHEVEKHEPQEIAARQARAARFPSGDDEPRPYRSPREAKGFPVETPAAPMDDDVARFVAQQERERATVRAALRRDWKLPVSTKVSPPKPVAEPPTPDPVAELVRDVVPQLAEAVREQTLSSPELAEASGEHVHRYAIEYEAGVQVGVCACGATRRYENPEAKR